MGRNDLNKTAPLMVRSLGGTYPTVVAPSPVLDTRTTFPSLAKPFATTPGGHHSNGIAEPNIGTIMSIS